MLEELAKAQHEAWRKLPQNQESIFNIDYEKLPEEQKEKNRAGAKAVVLKVLEEIERLPKELGIEKLAKRFPEFVRYIAMSYDDFQKIKKKFL